jgi:hypothetical protein
MTNLNIPEPKYYTPATLAAKLGCDVESVMMYGVSGQLQFSILSSGCYIEQSIIDFVTDDDYNLIPVEKFYSKGEILRIYKSDIQKLFKNQEIRNPLVFYSTTDTDNSQFEIISDTYGKDAIITFDDIIIEKSDFEEFLNISEAKTSKSIEQRRKELQELMKKIESLHPAVLDFQKMPGKAEDFQKHILPLCPSIGHLGRTSLSEIYRGYLSFGAGNKYKKIEVEEYWKNFSQEHKKELSEVFTIVQS